TGPQFVFLTCLGIIFSAVDWPTCFRVSFNLSWRPARLLVLTSTAFILFGAVLFGSRVIAEMRADRIFYQSFFPALGEGDVEVAEDVARSALSHYPDLFFARMKLAEILSSDGEYEEALFHTLANYSIFPHHYRNNLILGSALVNLGKHQEAIEVYARILRIIPDDRKSALVAAKLSQLVNDPERADRFLTDYSEAIENAEPDIFIERAELAEGAGDRERAKRIIHKGLIHHPESQTLIDQLQATSESQ
ncbi:MAG: tetratricopeptide repeat protein, partial [Verrucomicrobiota bacterium]